MRGRGGIGWCAMIALVVGCKASKPPAASAERADARPVAEAPAPPPTPAPPPAAPAPAPAPLPPVDWAALRRSEEACADCHPDQVDAWRASKMGQSFRPVAELPAAVRAKAATRVHPATGYTYTYADGVVTETAAPGHSVARPIAFVFGSGAHAHTNAWATEDQLLQTPLSWYHSKKDWDFSPGYALAVHPGLFRAVPAGCVACHSDPVPTRPGSNVHFERLPAGPFGCARCHGDGRAHAEARLDGRDAAVHSPDGDPLPRADDACAFCHYPGVARVLRAGRSWGDYLPGRPLHEVVAIFDRQRPTEGFGATDHFARLAQSECAQKTPQMTCATCHAPHPASPRDRSAACRDCHGDGGHAKMHACAGPGGEDCAECHMDAGATRDIPHVSATDHFIRVKPGTRTPKNNDSPLVWVARPEVEPADPDHQILLGRAYAEAWRSDGQPRDLERALRWLTTGLKALPERVDGWTELAAIRRLTGDATGEREAAERAFALAPGDRRVALLTAGARLGTGDAAGGLAALERAAAVGADAEVETLRARALRDLGRLPAALAAAEQATRRQPSSGEAWFGLGLLRLEAGQLDAAAEALTAATLWQPADLRGWLFLGQAERQRGRWKASLDAFSEAAGRAGPDRRGAAIARLGVLEAQVELGRMVEARQLGVALLGEGVPLPGLPTLMARIHLAAGELPQAREAIDAAVRFEPDDAGAWAVRAEVLAAQGDEGGAEAARSRAAQLRAAPAPGER
ncbi:MAG: tetratricopeptide repeat protein [Myxococcales bacterium]|nr:tetratricopeptide repeat protein [Myxococcales bacterium]